MRIWSDCELTSISHELNVTIIKSYFDPNKFREYFNWKHSEKKLIAEGKQISSKRMTLHTSFNGEIDFLLYHIGSVLPITRIYAYKYLHVVFDCALFACVSFCVYTEKDVRRNWTKPPKVELHLDQHPVEPVWINNHGINIILLKKFCSLPKAQLRCQFDPLILFSAGIGETGDRLVWINLTTSNCTMSNV